MTVGVAELARRMLGDAEWALLDVQEDGPFAEGHIFHACPVPYSRLEHSVTELVPRRATPIVVTDADGGAVAERAVRRLAALGYTAMQKLSGGNAAWKAAGHTLFQGVHVPSKAFGELLEHRDATPSVSARDFQQWRESGRRLAVLDGRPLEEYRLYTIPGSVCCPNGELALRAEAMCAEAEAIVVNCAGRTRSILGAETLRRLLPGRAVHALRNGTQGWFLAGLTVERGADRHHPVEVPPGQVQAARERVQALMRRHPVPGIDWPTWRQWQQQGDRSCQLLDVRTREEFQAGTLPGAVHAPGGQLLQATDRWVAVAGARIAVFDHEGVRAPVVAMWLREMGLDAHVLQVPPDPVFRPPPPVAGTAPSLPLIHPCELGTGWRVVDLRDSGAYRRGHRPGARWGSRPRLDRVVSRGDRVAFVATEPWQAELAALDAREIGAIDVALLADADAEGGGSATSPDDPADAECIDQVWFTAGRHSGSRAAAEQYLAWEIGLVRQMGPLEWWRFPASLRGA